MTRKRLRRSADKGILNEAEKLPGMHQEDVGSWSATRTVLVQSSALSTRFREVLHDNVSQ